MDNRRIRVRSDSRSQNIEGFQITHPSSKGCIYCILEGFGACFHSVNSRPHHFHAEDIKALAFYILCTHVNIALHTKLSCSCRSCHTMLTCSSFSDDSGLAHTLSQKNLPQNIIELMGTQMIEIFPLQINLSSAQMLSQTFCKVERSFPSRIIRQIMPVFI